MMLKEFFVKLGLDADSASFASAQLAVDGLKMGLNALARAGRFAFDTIVSSVTETAKHADKVDELSQSAGISSTALQELSYAAGYSGISMEGMASSLGKLSRVMLEAKGGSGDAADAFRKIGVRITDGSGKMRAADEVLQDLSAKFAAMPDGVEKTAMSMKFFGKSGAALIPFLNAGPEGIARLKKEANDLGLVLDEAALKAGVEAEDSLEQLGKTVEGLKMSLGQALIPMVKDLATEVFEWVKQNRELIKQKIREWAERIAKIALFLWSILKKIGVVVGFVVDNFELLTKILMAVGAALIYMRIQAMIAAGGMVTAGLAAMKTWIAAAAPVLALAAIFAAVYLIIQDIMVWMRGGDSVFGDLLGPWADAATAIKMMWKDALEWIDEKIKDLERSVRRVGNYLKGEFGDGTETRDRTAYWEAQRKAGTFDVADEKRARGAMGMPTLNDVVRQQSALDAAEAFQGVRRASRVAAELAPPMAVAAQQAVTNNQSNATKNVNVHKVEINGAKDPKAVADEFKRVLEEWQDGKMAEAAAATR